MASTSFVSPPRHESLDTNIDQVKLCQEETTSASTSTPVFRDENHLNNVILITTDNDNEPGAGEKDSLLSKTQNPPNDECTNDNSNDKDDMNPKEEQPLFKWPDPFDDESALERNLLQPLPRDVSQVQQTVQDNGTITIRSITWNQQAQGFPSVQTLREQMLLPSYFHLVVIGTQECENSIAKSLLYPSKVNWEKVCLDALGFDYELVRGHSLQASHLALYAHRSIVHLLSKVESTAVATGFCDKLGNKGGIAIKVNIGETKFCFLTAHLSAYQNQMDKRTLEFIKISKEVSRTFATMNGGIMDESTSTSCSDEQIPKESSAKVDLFVDDCLDKDSRHDSFNSTSTTLTCSFCSKCSKSIRHCSLCCCPDRGIKSDKYNPLLDGFDHVIWCGDFNFRINGTRDIVDTLLKQNRCDVLLDNDQLTMLMQYDKAFKGFKEGPVTFRPMNNRRPICNSNRCI